MKAYALTEFTDATGKHVVGDEVDIVRDTDEDKVNFDRLLRHGIITTSRAEAQAANDRRYG